MTARDAIDQLLEWGGKPPPSPLRLDDFGRNYIQAALWSSNDDDGDPLDNTYSLADIDNETLRAMVEDCAEFQEKYSHLWKGVADE